MSQRSGFSSILTLRCPRCRKGPLFHAGTISRPGSLFTMHSACPHCKQSYEPEPGFYFGAMFVSYGINTALFIASWITLTLVYPSYSLFLLLGLLVGIVLLSLPLSFRLSRSIWLALFVRFDPTTTDTGNH
jgi:uncharacterized protein (DUF983 family)